MFTFFSHLKSEVIVKSLLFAADDEGSFFVVVSEVFGTGELCELYDACTICTQAGMVQTN